MSGVASNWPGVVPWSASGVSQCFHCQACASLATFAGLTSVSGEWRWPPWSPPKYGHSTWRSGRCCANTPAAATTIARTHPSRVVFMPEIVARGCGARELRDQAIGVGKRGLLNAGDQVRELGLVHAAVASE